jgi:hypothetical protein
MHSNLMLASAVNLDSPGRYMHWSIFTISLANLVLVAVMVFLFGAALLVRFPRPAAGEEEAEGEEAASRSALAGERPYDAAGASGSAETEATGTSLMWTARLRNRALRLLPPAKLVPDRQPAYVSSWVYVFGVATLAALAVAIGSGFAIALGGTDWWHTNPVGHFFNSLHLWSVEIFMAFMVIHLWGKFWMAAWRGKRGRTWVTGVLAFAASIGLCFTGYLSQQNFDAQWISTNGKDAFNAAGIGAFFNLMNFGQMLLWHVVLLPILLVALVGAHVLLVRVRGVAHPFDAGTDTPWRGLRTRSERRAARAAEAAEWRGPTRRYDIAKEGVVATVLVLVLTFLLAGLLSSPDVPPIDLRTWAVAAPADFLGTTASELAGTSETADYGPPYNNGSANLQRIGVSWQLLAGVHERIDSARSFVIDPLSKVAATNPAIAEDLSIYESATTATRQGWANAYLKALDHVTFSNGTPRLARADDGPVPGLAAGELSLARAGGLDADLIAHESFYGTNLTKPLLFLEDGSYFAHQAQAQHLTGTQWGVMNETGSYPGQPWLWLYQLWYQLPGFKHSANVDLIAIYLTGAATILLLLVPFIPGLRDIPRWIPIHRLVWRSHYKARRSRGTGASVEAGTGT